MLLASLDIFTDSSATLEDPGDRHSQRILEECYEDDWSTSGLVEMNSAIASLTSKYPRHQAVLWLWFSGAFARIERVLSGYCWPMNKLSSPQSASVKWRESFEPVLIHRLLKSFLGISCPKSKYLKKNLHLWSPTGRAVTLAVF